jgi:TRAP-type C4-dicarboxylate transport system substrate-binding protein
MVHVGTFYYGVRHFTTKSKPLQTAADVKGLKIRVPEAPLFLAMIRALEATPTPMSLGEVYLSLQTGVADGQENPVGTINDQKFYEVRSTEPDRPRHRADPHHGEIRFTTR